MKRLNLNWTLPLIIGLLASCGGNDDDPADENDTGVEDVVEDNDTNAEPDADTNVEPDADTNVEPDADTNVEPDADTGYITPNDPQVSENDPIIIACGDLPAPTNGRICDVEVGSNNALLIRGEVLAGNEVLSGGEVLIDEDGRIVCAACSCGDEPIAADATILTCAEGIVSPGLINAHDHISYDKNSPGNWGDERFDHRHEWRRGLNGHTEINATGRNSREEITWTELRQIMSGTTSIAGSGSAPGLLRNIDRVTQQEGISRVELEYQTFPLGDTSGTLRTDNCNYDFDELGDFNSEVYHAHVAEGIGEAARNEFLCLSSEERGGHDYTEPHTVFVHGIGLNATDGAELAANGTGIVWSPRSNISLYGHTAPVTMFWTQGVEIGIGTDWTPSGSINMFRELACANELNEDQYNNFFTHRDLWTFATRNNASLLGVSDELGTIANGFIADIAIYDGSGYEDDPYLGIIEGNVVDTALVLRGGIPLYGDTDIMSIIPNGSDGCEAFPSDVCGIPKIGCFERDTGFSWNTLATENSDSYDLFACETPPGEPSCVPFRENEFDGISSDEDSDGDGVVNSQDNCPTIFNAARPLDGATQADFDGDGTGDVCDICPLSAEDICTPIDLDDLDSDGTPNIDDNCPSISNEDQLDSDADGMGDLCDACPEDANPNGAACPASIYDVKTQVVGDGMSVLLEGVVTANAGNAFFMQVPSSSEDYDGPAFSGTYVYISDSSELTIPTLGDLVSVNGAVNVFYGQTQISDVTEIIILSSDNSLPDPVTVTTTEVMTGGDLADDYEAVLVQINSATVTNLTPAIGAGDSDPIQEYVLNDELRVNDLIYLTTPFPQIGDEISITGPLRFANGDSKIEPRDENDIVFGNVADPTIQDLSPEEVYIYEGSSQTYPPIIATLTRPAPEGGITLQLSVTTTDAQITVAPTVTVLEGETSIEIPITGVTTGDTPATVEVTIDGIDFFESNVVVLAEDHVPTPIEASSAIISVGADAEITVLFDSPADSDGLSFTLTSANEEFATVSANETLLAGEMEATFIVTGVSIGNTTILITTDSGSTEAAITVSDVAEGDLLFSEYVEGSGGGNKLLELTNLFNTAYQLDTCIVNLYRNGATDVGREFTLGSHSLNSGESWVICNDGADASAHCDERVGALDFNGDDALELVCGGTRLDVIGQIGIDPGSAWGVFPTTTKDATLRRSCDVRSGDLTHDDEFNPGGEWSGFDQDTFDGLGSHCD